MKPACGPGTVLPAGVSVKADRVAPWLERPYPLISCQQGALGGLLITTGVGSFGSVLSPLTRCVPVSYRRGRLGRGTQHPMLPSRRVPCKATERRSPTGSPHPTAASWALGALCVRIAQHQYDCSALLWAERPVCSHQAVQALPLELGQIVLPFGKQGSPGSGTGPGLRRPGFQAWLCW